MIADSAARARALDISSSFIVQAPAGSGKTELLIQRYMKLLAAVDAPDAVVAITFTRKAAAEMRARVLQALRRAQAGQVPENDHELLTLEIARDVLARDRIFSWNLIDNPAQLRIETIDALCAAITGRMPWLARFGAMPEISEKAEDLYREAARNTLREVDRGNEALSEILLHLDNDFNAAERLIVQMLEKRDQWLRHTGVNPDFDSVRATLEASLQKLILDQLDRQRAAFDPAVTAEITALLEIDRFPDARIEDLSHWHEVANLLLTGGGEWRRRVDKNLGFSPGTPRKTRCEQLLARLQPEAALLEILRDFRGLPAPCFTDSQWHAMRAAVSVLTLAVAHLQMVFRERGRVDFAELSIRASDALGQLDSPTDLALALGFRIHHVLVDEFQDTSNSQFALLERLTAGWDPGDGRTLFLVGDPMQSIYRFREADVSLLLKARQEGIGSIRLEALTLSVNFRSEPAIVDWVNETFRTVLPERDDIDSGAVAYSPCVAVPARGEACVEFHPFLGAEDEAERVIELLTEDLLKKAGGAKTAILVRARSHLAPIVTLLKQNGIAFQAIEIDQLGEQPVVEDLMALTFALLHPADRVSWLAILRAPWCGLKLEDLHALAAAEQSATIWDLLHKRLGGLSDDGLSRVRRILRVLENALAHRARQPLRDWVEAVWLAIGGPACVNETALKDAAAYFDLLEGIERGADLDDFGWFREQVNQLFAQPDAQAGDRLQLMTIHKAKGLEFDTVIMPGLGERTRPDEPRLLLWLEQSGELLLAPISESGRDSDPIYDYLALVERRKVEHELARLLYVGTTRARSTLHLLGSVKQKDDGSIAEPHGFLKLLWPAVSDRFVSLPQSHAEERPKHARAIHRLPADWKTPNPPPSVVFRSGVERVESPQVTFEWAGERLRHVGIALHGLLEKIAREGLEAWNKETVRTRRSFYQTVFANLGVLQQDMSETIQLVEAGLLRTLDDPRGRWILDAHTDSESELSIAGLIDGKLAEVVIDRTFIDEQGVRWIIDYKTSEHQGGDLEAFLDSERTRYQDQLERYARLMFQQDQRPIRLGLYFPLFSGWREWGAPVVLRKQASLFEI